MGLPRPPEPFHRVYSPPEPPPAARRGPLIGIAATVVAVVLAVTVGLSVGFGGGSRSGGGRAEGPDRASVGGSSREAPTAPEDSAAGGAPGAGSPGGGTPDGRPFASVPGPCSGVAGRTLDRLVAEPAVSKSSNSSLATCTFTSTAGDFRWLRIETRVMPPAVSAAPVQDMVAFFSAQWARAHDDVVSRTVSLKRYDGLGDEAYRWYKLDEGQPTVVGEVAVRVRNAVVTVSYSRRVPSDRAGSAENERSCLADATSVAREVLTVFR